MTLAILASRLLRYAKSAPAGRLVLEVTKVLKSCGFPNVVSCYMVTVDGQIIASEDAGAGRVQESGGELDITQFVEKGMFVFSNISIVRLTNGGTRFS